MSLSQNIPDLPFSESKSINDWDLTVTNLHRVAQRRYEVAVLPVGAVEPHNQHLPQGQDFIHTSWVARRSCELAWQQCPRIICLPALPYGVDCNLMDFPLAIHVSQSNLDAMLRDIIVSLKHHGMEKMVIINGHGGNDFTPLVRQVQSDLGIHVFVCDWWKVALDHYGEIFETPDDHAGEFETSVALFLFPQLVELKVAADAPARPYRFEALEKGWVRTSRRFARLNEHCAVGHPARATAQKGQKYLDITCTRISKFLAELAQANIDDNFPHLP
jgi:creatinine amidohydrolase